jgi:PAS domain S-box-containing protein
MFGIEYLEVVLDEDANIVEYNSTIADTDYKPSEVIGKNWFDTFISTDDKNKIMIIFHDIINGSERVWQSYGNDVLCKNNRHKLIDFHNSVYTKNNKKYIKSIGIEHHNNHNRALENIVKKLT